MNIYWKSGFTKKCSKPGLTVCNLLEPKYVDLSKKVWWICVISHTREILSLKVGQKINFTKVVDQVIWPNLSLRNKSFLFISKNAKNILVAFTFRKDYPITFRSIKVRVLNIILKNRALKFKSINLPGIVKPCKYMPCLNINFQCYK